ncbi:MAG: potassium transporter KefB [Sphingobacteriales bacterium]|nr:MAG: potassium transporter KefB [Sphingobacteriales bacterium]
MMPKANLTTQGHPAPLAKCMLIGAAIGLAIISIFVFGVDNPDPEWGTYWRIKPLLLTPAAGAACGFFYHLMDSMHYRAGWNRMLTIGLSLLVCAVGLWIGVVLGLNGTMWD